MTRSLTSLKWSLFLLLTATAFAGGCSRKITITQYPEFWTEDLKTIAVVPFRCADGGPQAGDAVSEQFARAMAFNRTYNVFSRADLKTVLDEQDLRLALSGNPEASAKAFSKTDKVQGIITGTVTTYSTSSRNEPRRDPVYAYDRNGNQYITGYRDWVFTTNQGTVVVTAVMLRPDGTTIYATPGPIPSTAVSSSSPLFRSPPSMDPQTCRVVACRDVVTKLVEHFAVTTRTISVSNNAFRMASDYYDGKYAFTDTFKASDSKMLAVVDLPACCDRNRFRITVVKGEERTDLAEIKIVWQRDWNVQPFELSPRDIAAKGGPGKYTVKFYSGPSPVFTRTITIK